MAAKNPRNKPNELYITRIYEAPVKMVWDAWNDPAQAANWWGPRGFTITHHSKDLKPGGHWKYTMHGPDGTDYENITTYHEVKKYSRLVYDHGASETRPPLFRVEVDFLEEKGKTRIEMIMILASEDAARETEKFIKKAGGNATWDRLAEYLSDQEGKDIFVINRSFDAPQELVFNAWANSQALSQWLGPTGSTMKTIEGEVKQGKSLSYSMETSEGVKMWGKVKYLTLKPFSELLYTQIFTDEKGMLSRHPFAPTWPAEMLTRVQFESEGAARTRVTVTWSVYGEATPEERVTFRAAKAGMTMGWTGSFDKLEELLNK